MASWVWMEAYAAEGAAAAGSSIGQLLFLIGVVAAAYIVAHLVLERAQQRFLFVSGIEYVALGIVLGPSVFPDRLQPFGDLTRLGPVFEFAAGWVGLIHGLELRVRWPTGSWRVGRIALADSLVTGAATFGAAWALLSSGRVVSAGPADVWPAALALAAASASGSTSAIELLASRYRGLETELIPMLRRAIRGGDLVAFGGFAVLFCAFHQGTTLALRTPGPIEWALITVGLGVALGVVFLLFLGKDDSDHNVVLALVGILLFASGAAFFLHVSALLVNLVLGAALAQTALGSRIEAKLQPTYKPVSLVILLFAGVLWRPVPLLPGVLFVGAYLLARTAGKTAASVLATVGTPLRVDLFRGLLAQGNVAIAMAVSFRLVYAGPAADLVYTAVLFGTVLSEFGSPRLLRQLLADAGELREDLGAPARQPAPDPASAPARPGHAH